MVFEYHTKFIAGLLKGTIGNNYETATSIRYFDPIKTRISKTLWYNALGFICSTVRNEAREDSDIDIIVSFDGSATSKQYFGVQFFLEDELGQLIDLVTEKPLRPELKSFID